MSINIKESDIAIIGMSCRFPGAKDIDAFWQNLLQGVDSISFFSDEELSQTDTTLRSNPNYVKAGAILPNIDHFDAEFFGYSTKDAEIMDPQQRIFLECAWEAFESAGYNPETYQGLIGVYAGSGMNTYLINNVHPNRGFSPERTFLISSSDLQVRLGNGKDFLPTRVSYKLNLTGPSVNIQTACSTGLVAVHMASQSLLNGECDMALAGAVAICVPQKVGYLYQEDMIWSPDGHCRAFDAQAQGTVFGNGGGIVVLKLLGQALDDGDCIHAVIKGSAINNDGALKVGYTAPSVEGQAGVISEAMAIAQINPSTVTYVEAHGTATSLGDPVEITALTKAFRQSTEKKGFCAIGSVKTNIGHLGEAAGIAGLLKTVLALKHNKLPPSLHFSQPNPRIDFANSPFYVNATLSEWNANGTPRRAGISAFGMGGTNCHVVLEEAPESTKNKETSERPLHILTLSAKTQKALEELAQNYVVYLKSAPDASLADICFTANTGRKHFKHRLAVTAESIEQLGDRLSGFGQPTASVMSGETNNSLSKGAIAFLFTGQGSQYAGMGRNLYEFSPTFRQILDRCDEIVRPYLEVPLLEVLYPHSETTHSQLNETAYTQPALFALEYALLQLWKSWGIEPNIVMGHSVGEYVAACVAGVFSLEDGLKLIAARGRLMQALPSDGEMVAVLTDEAQAAYAIQPYVREVSISAINGKESIVISGRREAINAICAQLEASGVKTKKLNVSHAFHSPLMEPMVREFERVARQVSFSPPQLKLISNVTGSLVTDEVATPEYWCRHVLQPVRFAASIESLDRLGVERLVEIGAKPILLGMARSCLPDKKALWLPSLRPEQDDWQVMLASLAELYVHGVSVNWFGFDKDYSRRRLNLPTYPFQRQRYWVEAGRGYANSALFQNNGDDNHKLHPLLGQELYLAGTQEIRFQSQISPDSPVWVRDHCFFGATVLPGTAYLEMALAAGASIAKPENIWLEDVVLKRAMIWQSDEVKTVQVILTPQSADVYSVQIYSLVPPAENKEKPSWTLHTSGKLFTKGKESVAGRVDLAKLKAQCTQEFPIVELYQRFQEQELNYGSRFRGIEQLYYHEGVALGKIKLAEEVVSQLENYQLHPVLSDIVLQVMDVISPKVEKQNTYAPVGLERLRVYGRPSVSMWSYATLRKVEGDRPEQQIVSADLELISASGELIASLEGVQLKAVRREAMLGIPQESWKNWLYEVKWIPQVRYGLQVDYMPTASEISATLQPQFAELLSHPSIAVYGEVFTQLEALSVAYVLTAFQEMGWKFQLGARFSTKQIAEHLGVVSQHRQLLEHLLKMLASEGILKQTGSQWQVNSIPEIQDPRKVMNSLSCPEAEAELTLLGRCGSKLAQVLQGTRDPLQLLFPSGDTTTLAKLYQHSPMLRTMNVLVQKAVLSALERLPTGRGCRILEIGAGTGSTTNYILPHLPAEQIEYVFTDIGALFVAQAQEKFKAYPFVRYEVLDIEKDPQSQGFKLHQYDLIVAANVLHTTSDLRQTLQHVQQLLAPDGMLVLVEGTAPVRWVDLTFGLLEGWWKFTDHQLRPDYPLLPTRSWQKLLQEIGFKEIVTVEPDLDATQEIVFMPQSVLVAQAAAAKPDPGTKKNWLILADSQNIGQQLAAQLRSKGDSCTLVFPGNEYQQITAQEFRIDLANAAHFQQLCESIPSVQKMVHLWALDAPQPQAGSDLEVASKISCGSALYLVQALVNNYSEPLSLWLVTRGAQAVGTASDVAGLAQSSLWGMGKVIALEHPELNCVRVDLDPKAPDAPRVILEEISSETLEDMVAFRDGTRYVARLVRRQPPASWLRSQSFRLEISELGTLDNLQLVPTNRYQLSAGEVEIRVRSTGLNFKDILNALGLLPFERDSELGAECAGEIVAVGEGVEDYCVGDRVMAIAFGSFSKYVRVKSELVVPMPDSFSFEEAAAIPVNFVTAYYALHQVANISAKDKVLIHAAAGGTGMAAVKLALAAGAEVFATASPSKWFALRSMGVQHIYNSRTLDFASQVMYDTKGLGVDIVLNSLTGEGFIEKSLSILSAKGRFLELAKRDVWNSERVRELKADISYHCIDLGQICLQEPALIQPMLHHLSQQFAQGKLDLPPRKEFPIQEVVSAFRYMQRAEHIGKVVVTQPKEIGDATSPSVSFREDSSYLITGGLGDLGLLVARWMVERGARHLVLVGRNAVKPAVRSQLEQLELSGAKVVVAQADVSDYEQVSQLLASLVQSSPPLRGIIHAVGVLDDGVLKHKSWDQFARVMAPKVQGAWNLHTLTQKQPLDFFVLFSSAASLLGSAGQANHSAANAFLDALAFYRRSLGLPGSSINWGAWSEIGAAARNQQVIERLNQIGMGTIAPHQGLQVLEQLFWEAPVQVGVVSINWSRYLERLLTLSPFFTDLGIEIQGLHDQSRVLTQEREGDFLHNTLVSAPPVERQQLLESRLREQVAKVLGFSAAKLDMQKSLTNLGLDSLMAIELRNWINKEMGVKLPVIKIMEGASIAQLAELMLEQLALAEMIANASPSTELDDDMEEGSL